MVVPKPLTEQTEREWRTSFPDAKLLVVDNKDLSDEKKRELFTARVATGDYDAKYGKYAAAIKKAITNYSRIFVSDGEEMIAFHLFNKEAATIIKLFSIYIAAVQEMPEEYFDQISIQNGS